jgi:mycothiol system anti-sigma-R factor
MSCGNHHDTACREVLEQIYQYLDGELDDVMVVKITQHLQECGPCLEHREREALVMALVRRSCHCEVAPEELKMRILSQINAVYGDGCPASSSKM